MAKTGALMNYDFGQKRHWRRWVWNRIAERIAVRPESALCLYLPGAADVDFALAASKGFRRHNLIGVERDKDVRRELRARGVLTVDADFFRAVDAFGITSAVGISDVHVIFADLCHGLTRSTISALFRWINYPRFFGCTFAFNLARGREQKSNALLSLFEDESWATMEGRYKPHRGKVLLHSVFATIAGSDREQKIGLPSDPHVMRRYHWMLKSADAAFTSYRSTSRQTFDTIVFNNPMRAIRKYCPQVDLKQIMLDSGFSGERDFVRAKRSVAAVLAHRTRRIATNQPE